MWVERRPEQGETIMIEFAEWTNLGSKIGVFLKNSGGRMVIDFGDMHRWLDNYACINVWVP